MKIDRLISILMILLRKERIQAKALAEMFDVSVRTILRDVDALNLAGIPIVTYQGINGGIGIAEGYRLDKNVLTEDEMAAIITTLKGVSETMPDMRYKILVEKFKNILSPAQLAMLNTKTNQLVIDLSPWGGRGSESHKEKIATIRKAIENFKEVEFAYTDSEGNRTRRSVEPYSLVLKGQNWYLYAWCIYRQDFRIFKLSRIKELIISDISYKPREIAVEPFSWEDQWQAVENTVFLELIFDKEMENIVEEWFGEDIEKHDDGRIMAKVALPENNWLYGFLLSFGAGVEVVSPPHIRTRLREIAKKIYNKYAI